MDMFDIAECIKLALSESMKVFTIRDGFERTGFWVQSSRCPSLEPLKCTIFVEENGEDEKVSSEELFERNCRQSPSLVRENKAYENGNMKVSTAVDAHLTADVVSGALQA